MNKLQKEIDSFQKVWKGGYKTGYSNKRNQAGLEIYLADKLSWQESSRNWMWWGSVV